MATTDDFTENGEGLKRICQSCGTKYYDLNKDPIVCPNCGTEFDPEAVLSSRRGRISDEPTKTEQDAKDDDQLDPEIEEVVAEAETEDEDEKFKDTGSDDTLLVEEDDGDDALGGLAVGGDDDGDDDN